MDDIRYLLEGLQRSSKILSEFVKAIPKSKLDLRRGKNFWTITEHISHLAQVQPMLLERFEHFINVERPVFEPYIPGKGEDEPDTPSHMSMTSALDQFAAYRDKQLALLNAIDSTTWKKTATHPEYESYSLYILTRHVLMHDYWHMYRMEELWLTRDAFLTRLE